MFRSWLLLICFLVGCNWKVTTDTQQQKFYQLGVLLQGATKISVTSKVEVPFAWSRRILFFNKRYMCLIQKKMGTTFTLRLVLYRQQECSLDSADIILQWSNLAKFSIKQIGKTVVINNGEYRFHLLAMQLPLTKNRITECGKKGQQACYRGRNYKESVNTSCSTENEDHFCSVPFKIYCKQGRLECI